MADSKMLLLVFLYAICYCVDASERLAKKSNDDESIHVIPEPREWLVPEANLGNTLVGKIGKWLERKQKQPLDLKVEQYELVTRIDTSIREMSEDSVTTPELTSLTIVLSNLRVLFNKIDDAYEHYLFHHKSEKSAMDPVLRHWVQQTRNEYFGPINWFNDIFSMTVPLKIHTSYTNEVSLKKDATLLTLLTKNFKSYRRLCSKDKSQQQILHILYNSILFALYKVHIIMEFCYRKLDEIGETNYDSEMKLLWKHGKERYDLTTEKFEQAMRVASREVWRCNPKVNVEDKSYVQLYNVFQKFVVHDNDVNDEHNCRKTCDSIKHGKVTNCDKTDRESHYDPDTRQDEESICGRQRTCDGHFYDCKDYFVDHKELWICPSTLNSTRRYEFMMHGKTNFWTRRTDISKHYGRKAQKSDCNRTMSYDYRTWGKSFADAHRDCEVCLCTCIDWRNPQSDMWVNIRPAVADKDYVVTGARLVKANHTLHIQIEQGKALKNGEINSSTIHWKEIAPVRNPLDLHFFSQQCKDIYLGVTDVPNDSVIVGLKLSKILYTGGHQMIGLRTLSAFYDYNTGTTQRLNAEQELEEENFDGPQSPVNISESVRVDLKNADISTNNEFENQPQPDSMLIVNVTTTDFEKDLGQTLIPFFDIQEVKARPAVPLSGIGFYHKGREGYGGFVGIKLLTYDYSNHLN